MPTAGEIARAALEEEERPERERQARMKKQQEAKAKRDLAKVRVQARRRLADSKIPVWFPGVDWTYIESCGGPVSVGAHSYDLHLAPDSIDVWESGENHFDVVRLGVLSSGPVVFVTYPTSCPKYPETRWDGVIVNSAADVARQVNDYLSRTRIPDNVD